VISLYNQQLSIPHLQFKQTKRSFESFVESSKLNAQVATAILTDPHIIENRNILKKRKKIEKENCEREEMD
jgi:hypothetical protein